MRMKLSNVEKAISEKTSIQAFISSILHKPECGVIIYTPTIKYRWAVSYIRFQETEQYSYLDSKYLVEFSTVGEHQLKEQSSSHIIRREDLKLHHEISVCWITHYMHV